jgi:hypothetical protein
MFLHPSFTCVILDGSLSRLLPSNHLISFTLGLFWYSTHMAWTCVVHVNLGIVFPIPRPFLN